MKDNKFTKILEDLGLTENEARVYLASLSVGPANIQKIADAAEIKRTTAYSVVDSLQQKGLMSIELQRLKKLYAPENPEKLEGMLETKRSQFKNLLPEFEAMYNLKGGESLIKYYEGLEGIKTVYEGLLRDIRPHEDYSVISNSEYWYNLDPEYFQNFLERRAKKNINVRLLLQDTPFVRKLYKESGRYNHKLKMLPASLSLTTNLVVIPKRVLIQQLNPPIMGISIENKSIIKMHQEMFEIIWNSISA